jgi:hypothetical protein
MRSLRMTQVAFSALPRWLSAGVFGPKFSLQFWSGWVT